MSRVGSLRRGKRGGIGSSGGGRFEKEHKLKDDLECFPNSINTVTRTKKPGIGRSIVPVSKKLGLKSDTSAWLTPKTSPPPVATSATSTKEITETPRSVVLTDSDKTPRSIPVVCYPSKLVKESSMTEQSQAAAEPGSRFRSWSQMDGEDDTESEDEDLDALTLGSAARRSLPKASSKSPVEPEPGARGSGSRKPRISSREEAIAKATGKGPLSGRGGRFRRDGGGPRSFSRGGGGRGRGRDWDRGPRDRDREFHRDRGRRSHEMPPVEYDRRGNGGRRHAPAGAFRGGPPHPGDYRHFREGRGEREREHRPGGGRGYERDRMAADFRDAKSPLLRDAVLKEGVTGASAPGGGRRRVIDGQRLKFKVKILHCDAGDTKRSGRRPYRRMTRMESSNLALKENSTTSATPSDAASAEGKRPRFPTRSERVTASSKVSLPHRTGHASEPSLTRSRREAFKKYTEENRQLKEATERRGKEFEELRKDCLEKKVLEHFGEEMQLRNERKQEAVQRLEQEQRMRQPMVAPVSGMPLTGGLPMTGGGAVTFPAPFRVALRPPVGSALPTTTAAAATGAMPEGTHRFSDATLTGATHTPVTRVVSATTEEVSGEGSVTPKAMQFREGPASHPSVIEEVHQRSVSGGAAVGGAAVGLGLGAAMRQPLAGGLPSHLQYQAPRPGVGMGAMAAATVHRGAAAVGGLSAMTTAPVPSTWVPAPGTHPSVTGTPGAFSVASGLVGTASPVLTAMGMIPRAQQLQLAYAQQRLQQERLLQFRQQQQAQAQAAAAYSQHIALQQYQHSQAQLMERARDIQAVEAQERIRQRDAAAAAMAEERKHWEDEYVHFDRSARVDEYQQDSWRGDASASLGPSHASRTPDARPPGAM